MKIATYKLTNLGAGNHILRAKATDGTLVSAFSNAISYSRVAVHTAVLNCSTNAPTAVSIGKSLTASFLTHGGDYANYTFATGTILVKMDDGTGTLQDITSTAWSYSTGSDGREIGIVQIGNVTGTVYISVTAGEEAVANYILFAGETSDFTLKATNKSWNGTVEYSTDKNTWSTWDGSEIPSANKKLYLRGKNNTTFYSKKGAQFVLSAKAGCYGNINTLLDYENPPTAVAERYCYSSMFQGCTSLTAAPDLPATTLETGCYMRMFQDCTSLTTAPELPATTLAGGCYQIMFSGCTSLTTAPALPATTLASNCYSSMFSGCTSLTTAPALPATTLAESCYRDMFSGCTSLTTGPSILPATTLEKFCYYSMFAGCTSLTTAPELPATTLAQECCYYMFQNCTSLTTGPSILPATTLEKFCYMKMFIGCTSLTTAPELPATTLAFECYHNMFQGCTSLTTAPELPATTLARASDCYHSMFQGCTSLTTAPELPATTLYGGCYQSMFQDCTSLTTAPELPATTLYGACYQSMFEGCTSLTTAPELPATTLAGSCYRQMFQGCTGLKISATQTGEYTTAWRIPSAGKIKSTATQWSVNMLANTGGTFTANPSINTTYYGAW